MLKNLYDDKCPAKAGYYFTIVSAENGAFSFPRMQERR